MYFQEKEIDRKIEKEKIFFMISTNNRGVMMTRRVIVFVFSKDLDIRYEKRKTLR